MLAVVVLICSIATTPDDCRDLTALQVVSGGQARTVASCAAKAQESLARAAIKPATEREYAKVQCLHKKEVH
jgi:hypothetical protein